MSIFKKNSRLFGSPVQSGVCRISSIICNPICATILGGFILCGVAKAQNETLPGHVLLNPGAESGLTNWNVSTTGYIYTVSTNTLINGAGSGNVLAHSGGNVFELFDTTGDSASIYQDFAAVAGSEWSASCYAICYASNYFSAGASATMQVSFYDATNGLLTLTNALYTDQGNVYGSDFLDPAPPGPPFNYIIAPPMAVDASGWLNLLATNIYDSDPASEAEFDSVNPTTTLYAPPGTAKVRFMLLYTNSADNGGAVYFDDCDLVKLVGSDPDITNAPLPVTIYAGLPASFSVVATRALKPEILRYQWQKDGTNLPPTGGVFDINGATTNSTLAFTNCQAADAGLYDVVVSDVPTAGTTNSIRSVPVPLTVLTLSPLQKVNTLGANSGFENNPVWSPWNIFNGCYFATTNAFYDAGDTVPVNVYDGNSVAIAGANGDRDNGFWQAVPATPGSVWKAGGWAYISSSNDFNGGNTCRLQIWFKPDTSPTSAAVPGTPTFESFKIYGLGYTNADAQYLCIDTSSPNNGQTLYHTQLPRDRWNYLPVTNVVNNAGIGLGDDLPYDTFPDGDFTVPTNTAIGAINLQVYEYCPVAADDPQADLPGVAADAVYWDDMELIQVVPPTNFTATVSGNNVNLSFMGQAGLNFAVLYKTNLTDATWNVLTNVTPPMSWETNTASVGTYYPLTVSDPISGAHSRFYRVQAQ